jgi:uncharacterized protein involved in outer membrane biogenesis
MSLSSTMSRVPPAARVGLAAIAGLIVLAVLFAMFFRWNMLRGPLAREASAISGRPISIDGDLTVHPWSFTPTATIRGLKIGNPAWMHGGLLADIPAVTLQIRLLPLLHSQTDLMLVDLEKPRVWLFRDAQGRSNWSGPNPSAPTKLPPIEHFVITGGVLNMNDVKASMKLDGVVWSNESVSTTDGGGFRFHGSGVRNGFPLTLDIAGGPLLHLRADQPYPFDADVRQAQTHVVAHGSLDRPFDFGHFHAGLTASGRDLADLYDLIRLGMPNTPAYHLTGQLTREGQIYTMTHLNGRVGQSDLAGHFTVDKTSGRAMLRADLSSRQLRFADLGSLVGAPPPGERTPLQKAQAATRAAQGRIMPDATLNASKLRSLDAVVQYRAGSVTTQSNLPLRQASLDLSLDHGLLVLNPIAFDFPHGALSGRVTLNGREATPTLDIDLTVKNVRIEDFIKGKAGQPPVEGILQARARLHGVGDSIHKAAATANGEVTLVVPQGDIRKAFAELMGIDATKGLGLLLSKNQSEEKVRCAVADFRADHGMLHATNIVLDTDQVSAQGQGTVNLADETLNLSLQGRPKSFRLVRLMAPITLRGHLDSPKIGVSAGKVPIQAAAAVGLAVFASPLAIILPFVDPGLAKNADCVGLVSAAKSEGAPVKVSATTPAPAKKKR